MKIIVSEKKMKDFLKALALVLSALGIFFGGGVLWYFYTDAMRIFFMVVGSVSAIVFLTCMTMSVLHVAREW